MTDGSTLELECTILSPITNKNDEQSYNIENEESDIKRQVNMYDVKQKCKSCINDCMYEDYYNCLDSNGFVALGPLQRFCSVEQSVCQ